jgi:mannobiose 2-epimerase
MAGQRMSAASGAWPWLLACGLLLVGGRAMADEIADQDRLVMQPESWRRQALMQVMPPWLEHGRDREHGGFHTGLTREWQPTGSTDRYPTMVGRHLYSLSAAYLLGGDEQYLELARQAADWLVRYGWDAQYGGWYRSVSVTGVPVDTVKDAFTQMYATTGLALYCLVTRDPGAWQYLERAHDVMQNQAWDRRYGGYYVELNRDLSVRRDQKSFNPQIGLLSSYMLYRYLVDPTPGHLAQMQRDMGLALDHMRTPEQGLVRDDFSRDWVALPRQQEGTEFLSAGGNIETSWVLMRLYGLTGCEPYRQTALDLAAAMKRWAWDPAYGGWYPGFARIDPTVHGTAKVWFIQAYGNFMALYAYRLTEDPSWLDYFRRTAVFWNQYLLDPVYGGDCISVDRAGHVLDGTKANSSKGSYHTMEHALLNYLYLSLFVQHQPATLYFHVKAERVPGDLRVCPVEDPDVMLARVELNGRPWTAFDGRRRSVRLPDGDCLLTVELVDGR